MELFTPAFFSALVAIIVIDIVLAGDNAIVIALAARTLPDHLRKRAVLWGTLGAVVVRSVMTLAVVWLLNIPGLLAAGGLLLLWIAYKLLIDDAKPGEHVAAATSFAGAMRTIIVADAVMGIDNVLAVAGAAHGSYLLVVLGLLISIPIVIWGSTLILKYTERFPSIVYLGAAVLVFTAVKMVLSEPVVRDALAGQTVLTILIYIATIAAVLLAGYARSTAGRLRRAMRTQAAVRLERRANEIRDRAPSVAASNPAVPTVATPGGIVMEKILLPVDGSKNALAAVREVIDEYMRNQSAEVMLFNVQPKLSRHVARFVPGRERANWHAEQAELSMKAAKELLNRWGVPYKSCFALGERAEVIADFAQENHCTRIVIGTARKNSLTRLFENSVTAALLERARVPVQIVVGSDASRLERFGVPAGVGAALAAVFIAAD